MTPDEFEPTIPASKKSQTARPVGSAHSSLRDKKFLRNIKFYYINYILYLHKAVGHISLYIFYPINIYIQR